MNSLRSVSRLKPVVSNISSKNVCIQINQMNDSWAKFSTSSVNFLKEIIRKEENGVTTIAGVHVPSPRENNLFFKKVKLQNQDQLSSPQGKSSNLPVDSANTTETDLKPQVCDSCPMCKLGLPVKHTDVLILSQFLKLDGSILPRRVTGLCVEQDKRMKYLIVMAKKAGLMPNFDPRKPKREPSTRYGWEKYNKYYDESVIDDFLNPAKKYVKKA